MKLVVGKKYCKPEWMAGDILPNQCTEILSTQTTRPAKLWEINDHINAMATNSKNTVDDRLDYQSVCRFP
jgi:hypothetical protein